MSQTREEVGQKVRRFYEDCAFPGYEEFESLQDLIQKAQRGTYAKLLDEQLPLGSRILDAGCGTGQLTNWLAVMNRRVIGIDLSMNSLRKGHAFKTTHGTRNARFVQMDLFALGLRAESFDVVFSNGVLHHTADARGAFAGICRLVKPGGHIVLGLYNTYGRLLLDARRVVFRLTRGRLLWLDYFMRSRAMGAEKKRVWFRDQYEHPHEDKFSVADVLAWFDENGLEYVNSVPRITFGGRFGPDERLFEPRSRGSALEHLLVQLGWIVTKGREGGFFILIGRRR